jgi:Protein of unknown function (DUF3015)
MMAHTSDVSLRIIILFLFTLALSSCTITETVSDFLSSTTPGDWYTRDGLPKAEHRVDMFLATNLANVKEDAARGRGEYLDSLGRLLHVDPARQTQFAAVLQEQYPLLAEQDRSGVTRAVIAAAQAILPKS